MVNLWRETVKALEKIVRDNYEPLAKNTEAQVRRVRDQLMESGAQPQNDSANEVPVPNEYKRKVLELRKIIDKIKDSLQNINTLCNPMVGEPRVNPGAHTTDISDLKSNQELIRSQINAFRRLVSDKEEEFALQLNFLSQMEVILQGQKWRTICLELENVVDRGDSGTVKQYGEMAGELFEQIQSSVAELDGKTTNPNVDRDVIPLEPPPGDNNIDVWF